MPPLAVTLPIYYPETTAGLLYGTVGALLSLALLEGFYGSRADFHPSLRRNLQYGRSCLGHTLLKLDTAQDIEKVFLLYAAHKVHWKVFLAEVYLRDRRIEGPSVL